MKKNGTTVGVFSLKNILLIVVLLAIGVAVYFLKHPTIGSDRYEKIPLATHSNGQQYVGSNSCMECHADIFSLHVKTAHYSSSALADSNSVKGSFKEGRNLYLLNDSVEFKMVSRDTAIFQEAFRKNGQKPVFAAKMDVVIGSGTKGQSYLTWNRDELYQLPISYLAPSDHWAISPGMDFKPNSGLRPVNSKCLECHTTFAKSTSLYGMGNAYDRTKIVYGIDCERCHGPSSEHVDFHKNNPKWTASQFMIEHDSLSRQQRLDACALCHSGVRSNSKPAFLFVTGDKLLDHSLPDTSTPMEEVDVHGNQYALLQASPCFKETPTMDCTTCHNPHKNQRGNTDYFNSKCIECHQKNTRVCKEDVKVMAQFGNNCISCHMPPKPSISMFVQEEGDSVKTAVEVRTHLIGIYPKMGK